MRLRAEQLAAQLKQPLLPVYLLHGEEALLLEEAADAIRSAAKQQEITDRQVWHIDGRFDWSQIRWQQQTMSLFASKQLVEIRLPSGAPGKEGGEALRNFCQTPPDDTLLLIISGKIDNRSQKSKWFSEIESLGATIAVWPVDAAALPQWIAMRLKQKGLTAERSVTELIAERVEGNLFAAAQEIEKFALLADNATIDAALVQDCVADNARFKAFDLMDTVYAGNADKANRMLVGLQAEGNDISTVLSAVSWSLHRTIDMAIQYAQGMSLGAVFSTQQPAVWDSHKPMLSNAIQRHDEAKWRQFLVDLAMIDQAIKGITDRCPWLLLQSLCLQVAGVAMPGQNEERKRGY